MKRTISLSDTTEERIKTYMAKERLRTITETIQVMIARCVAYEKILDVYTKILQTRASDNRA